MISAFTLSRPGLLCSQLLKMWVSWFVSVCLLIYPPIHPFICLLSIYYHPASCPHACTYTSTHALVCACKQTCVYASTRTWIHPSIYFHIYIHVYTHSLTHTAAPIHLCSGPMFTSVSIPWFLGYFPSGIRTHFPVVENLRGDSPALHSGVSRGSSTSSPI